jgi:hypothetical protein
MTPAAIRPILAAIGLAVLAPATRAADSPAFADVFNLVRSNLAGVSENDLNRAAIRGFLKELYPRVLGPANPTPAPKADSPLPPRVRAQVLERTLARVRCDRIEAGVGSEFSAALDGLLASNRVDGLVLDLRFASGWDYAEAARLADRFVRDERAILRWNDQTAWSTAKTNAFQPPVVLLVNAETRGAAEALAGALRRLDVGLLLGSATAGEARLFKEFDLGAGQSIRIATGPVRLGDDAALPEGGLKPDIEVAVRLDEERLAIEDPYRPILRGLAATPGPRTVGAAAAGATNRASRLTEADLVRMKREGIDHGVEDRRSTTRSQVPDAPQITDSALARAVDLLKGLAVLRLPR